MSSEPNVESNKLLLVLLVLLGFGRETNGPRSVAIFGRETNGAAENEYF